MLLFQNVTAVTHNKDWVLCVQQWKSVCFTRC